VATATAIKPIEELVSIQPKSRNVVNWLLTCSVTSLSLYVVRAGCRRPVADILLYFCYLCYTRIYIAADWIVHRGIKQAVSDQFTVFFYHFITGRIIRKPAHFGEIQIDSHVNEFLGFKLPQN
jgi:hypothetical protein